MHNKSQKISLKFNSTPSCLTRSEFTFPIFINCNSAENLVAQFNLSTDILKDVATVSLTIITSQPNFLSLKFLVVCSRLSGSLV